ncbi:MAG: hypothetical protein DRP56_05220 [Planctomycetota bacterium]|nr:MAG: hypothetical protein DRP56_05220 [Planctomycetota bacterium]
MVRVELTPKEQKMLLKYCQSIDRNIYERIMYAPEGTMNLLIEDCQYLRGCIQLEMEHITIPKIQNILGRISNKLSTNPVTRSVAEEIEGQNFESMDDLNNHLQGFMMERNTAPDPEMGGLSPEQVTLLIYSRWDREHFPLKFNAELEMSDLKQSSFFQNVRTLLNTLLEMEKEKTATVRGNLNRKLVKTIHDRLILEKRDKEFVSHYKKVLNEEDVFPLHIARIVSGCAGLIHKRKDKFLVKKKYQKLLSDENAGELYTLLFRTYFETFNLSYLDGFPELYSIQHTIPYSLLRLKELCKGDTSLEGLHSKILLPAVQEEVREEIPKLVQADWIIRSRIIRPLEAFGLLNCTYEKSNMPFSQITKCRKTPLFDKFMKAEW